MVGITNSKIQRFFYLDFLLDLFLGGRVPETNPIKNNSLEKKYLDFLFLGRKPKKIQTLGFYDGWFS